jgi:peptide/nickel transport system substrate-binding protein
MIRLTLALLLVAALPAHAETPAVVVGKTFIAQGEDPAHGSDGWALVSHGVGETLFAVDREGALVPKLAEGLERESALGWIVRLREDARLSDGTPLTAALAAVALARTVELHPAARASAGRMRFEALSERELLVETEWPVPALAAVLAEWPMVVYGLDGGEFLFTGPYAIAERGPDRMRLEPNAHYPAEAPRPAIELRRIADPQALALAFEAGELDLAFHLPAELVPRLRRRDDLLVESFLAGYQYMLWMNNDHPPLDDVRVRRAIDLGIDREILVKAVDGGEPATGAFARIYPFALDEPRPFEPGRAAALLDEAGWRVEDGVRQRDGEPLRLTLYAYPQRPDLLTFQPVLRSMLADLGIEVTTHVTESPNDLAASGRFDLLLWAQHTAPSGDPGFFLGAFLRSDAGNNHPRYRSEAFDAILDRLAVAEDPADRVRLAREAQQRLIGDAPVAFLTTPVWHVGLSPRLRHYEPWGSDYYVIRGDLRLAD